MKSASEEAIWTKIVRDGYETEHSMASLHRKQTGSYYTNPELALAMMKEMIDSLPEAKRNHLYQCSFLEPCVGTGNFVFAYLLVCKELGYTVRAYQALLDNIYVCDINKTALAVYQTNLTLFARDIFGIHLDEKYFQTHIGSGLLVDVDAEVMRYIPITDVFPPEVVRAGFDFVVTNPPYKNLKAEKKHYESEEEYSRDQMKYASIGKLAAALFPHASSGTINLYKLFVEEIIQRYLAPNGVGSLLIPASILSDKTCAKLRTLFLDTVSLKAIRIIAEDSNDVDASQALCSMLFHKGEKSSSILVDGSFRGDPAKAISVSVSDITDEQTGNAILVLTEEQYALRHQMRKHPTIKSIPYIKNLRGELDLTLNKESICQENTGYKLIRGRHIGYYAMNGLSPDEYVCEDFVRTASKNRYIAQPRLACQQIVNMAKKRRISFTPVPAHCVLGNSCNFIVAEPNRDGVDMYYLLGILNSALIDWYFKLTSSNNHINNYEIDNFPIPVSYPKKEQISALARKLTDAYDPQIVQEIDRLVREAYGTETAGAASGNMMREGAKATVFQNRAFLLERFAADLAHLVPGITQEDCSALLDGNLSVQNLLERFDHTPFDAKVIAGIAEKYGKLAKGQILNHMTFKLSELDLEMIRSVPQGGSWKDIPPETVQKSKRLARIAQTGGRTTLYGRIDYAQPSYTITTYFNRPGNGTYVHPVHERMLSVREAARFQCFPDSYAFFGSKTDMLKQVGNAVPVFLAYCIGRSIREKTGCSASVDLFSGAGGMTYGFKLAGIHALAANDILEPACVTLKMNNPEIPVICGDITSEATKTQMIEKGLAGKADIICGGPPCQGFSMAGWRMKDDPRNQLFRHFVDIVSKVQPKVIVFENVEGILSYQNGKTYRDIITLFSELGYDTEGRKLMANHFAAPQRRKRVIILCTRKDLNIMPSDIFPAAITPNPDRQISAYETMFDLEQIECSDTATYHSDYQSRITQYFKDEISVEEYIRLSADPRGALTPDEAEDSGTAEDAAADCPRKGRRKKKDKSAPDGQMPLFEI